jgi:hypothetical protein
MNEEKEHLTVTWMNGRVADHTFGFVDRNQENIRRCMVGNELIPVLRRKHRLGHELPEVGPARTYGRVEDSSDGRSVSRDGRSKCDSHALQSDLVHEMPPRALGSRV